MERFIPELFNPILEIYPSEFKRKIYLDNFLYYMFDQKLIDKANEAGEVTGIYYDNLFANYHFENFAYTITSETCKVIASFISYLGTNGGNQYFADVERFKKLPDIPAYYAYELAWSYENMRKYGHNNGYRTIEYILNSVEYHPGPSERYFKEGYYDPSVENYETIEYVCKWLASSTGQEYLAKCKKDIQIENEIRAEYGFKRNS